MVAPRFRLRFLNELFSPRRRHTAGASALGAHHAPGRQPARNIAFALQTGHSGVGFDMLRLLTASRFDQTIANGVAHETGERGQV